MYMLAPYVEVSEKAESILLKSNLYHNTIKIFDSEMKKEFWRIVEEYGCADLTTDLTKGLHEEEMLLTKDELNKTFKNLFSLMNENLALTIMPTEACNFRCPYCYENHKPIYMKSAVVDKIKAYIKDQASNYSIINISWFGGEPTLCKDTVLDISQLVQSLQNQYGFKYYGSMTSNGYLLNKNLFCQFYAAGITNYQITLDGWNHDKTRPHISGHGTLQTIIRNLLSISMLSPQKFQFEITLRHNILAKDEDYSWYDYLYRLFGHDKRFDVLVRGVGDWGGDTVKNLELLQENQKDEVLKKHIDYLYSIGFKTKKKNNGLFSKVCYASFPNSMVFRSDGKIEKCTVALDSPENYIGFVDSQKGVLIDKKANAKWTCYTLEAQCYSCKDVLSCFNLSCKKRQLIDNIDHLKCNEIDRAIY